MPRRNAQPHYNEQPNADGSISRFVYPTINGKPCWRKIPEDGKWDGLRGYRRFLAKVIEEETNKNEGSKVTFEAVALKWLDVRQRTRAAGTALLDKKNLHRILLPRFGAKRYSEIERDDVQQMVFDLVPDRLQRATMLNVLKTLRLVITNGNAETIKLSTMLILPPIWNTHVSTPMKTKPEKAEP